MGNAGKVLAIIGAVIGILSVVLAFAMPALFSWYHIDLSGAGYSGGLYVTAFGGIMEEGILSSPTDEIITLVLIGGILVLAGAALCIVSALTELKPLGLIGGILMILGPLFLIFDLMGQMSEFAEFMDSLATAYDSNVFFGSFSPYPGISFNWGIWIGFFLAIGGGVVGLIGGATV
ncbi:MAG: hypothetical protein ACFFA6_09280 [Promethearchaeota archaeon]